jgi:FkbM family methyltransferase
VIALAKKPPAPTGIRAAGSTLAAALRATSMLFGRESGARIAGHASQLVAPVVNVATPRGSMRFWCPSATSAKYAVNFLRYEPDTRAWLENFIKPGDHLWDVGANIGAYSLYATLVPGVTVTAFEPVAGTYAALTRNISLNGFAKDTIALCIALSDHTALAPFYLRNTEVGGAMHALGSPDACDGKFEAETVQHVLSLRGDDLVKEFGARPPDHVKIDVDGHELRVLKGLTALLPAIQTLWVEMVEISDASGENARIEAYLSELGFSLEQRGDNGLFINRKLGRR